MRKKIAKKLRKEVLRTGAKINFEHKSPEGYYFIDATRDKKTMLVWDTDMLVAYRRLIRHIYNDMLEDQLTPFDEGVV